MAQFWRRPPPRPGKRPLRRQTPRQPCRSAAHAPDRREPVMKRIFFALILVLASGAVGAQAPAPNAWSNEDYDFYAGDFNGDGYTDLLYVARDPSNPSGILLSDGTAPTIAWQSWASDYLGIPWSSNAYTVVVGDFNEDGKTDIFLQSNIPGDSYLLLTDSSGKITAISQTLPAQAMGLVWSADQHRLVVGDFNGDRHADLFFQPVAPGGLSAVVYSDANGQFTSATPAQSWNDGYLGFNWSVPEATIYAGDFNGDGRSDLLIQAWPQNLGTANGITNYNYPPNLNGAVLAQPATGVQPFMMSGVQSWSGNAFGVDWSPLNFTLVIGDFNGDGLSDALFQPLTASGSVALLLGHSPGAIFTNGQAALPTNVGISADVATLIPGDFAGGKAAGLLIQATSRTGNNSIARNITSGIRAGGLALPTLTATSVQPAPAPSTTGASAPAPLAATVTPTSARRTAGQFSVTPTGAA